MEYNNTTLILVIGLALTALSNLCLVGIWLINRKTIISLQQYVTSLSELAKGILEANTGILEKTSETLEFFKSFINSATVVNTDIKIPYTYSMLEILQKYTMEHLAKAEEKDEKEAYTEILKHNCTSKDLYQALIEFDHEYEDILPYIINTVDELEKKGNTN